jgi:hypothetical protein
MRPKRCSPRDDINLPPTRTSNWPNVPYTTSTLAPNRFLNALARIRFGMNRLIPVGVGTNWELKEVYLPSRRRVTKC